MDSLFGWPQAPAVTPLELLGLLGGIPLVVVVVVFAIAKAHGVLQASKRGPGPQPGDPVWLGGRALSIMGGAEDLIPDAAETERRQISSSPSTPTAEADAGGAGARW